MRELIANYDGVKRYLENCKDDVITAEKIVLFGSAKGGEKVWDFLEKLNVNDKVIAVLDNDISKQGIFFHGLPIRPANDVIELFEKYANLIVVIASGSAHIIKRQLLKLGGVEERFIRTFAFTNLQTNPSPYEYFWQNIDKVEQVYNILSDEKLKKVFVGLINYKITMEQSYLNGISDHEEMQYFDELMHYSNNENFVDCGAYIGDTLDIYANKRKLSWKKYYCFEADDDVYMRLNSYIKENGYENVETYNVGCWSKREKLHFNARGSGSSTIELGNGIEIEGDSLDHLLYGKEVSIIKMDIEGAEKEALYGSQKIIQIQHPKLAISIYHSLEDFLNLPMQIVELNPNYKIYMRHYRELTDSETICYAI